MIQINKLGNNSFKKKMMKEKEGQDLQRYEIDIEYFIDWFKINSVKI